jgi:hypothetical protein
LIVDDEIAPDIEAVVGIAEASGHQMIAWGESRHEVNSLWSDI